MYPKKKEINKAYLAIEVTIEEDGYVAIGKIKGFNQGRKEMSDEIKERTELNKLKNIVRKVLIEKYGQYGVTDKYLEDIAQAVQNETRAGLDKDNKGG